jgi:hypothetical protein
MIGCCPAQAVELGLQSLQRPVVALQFMQGSGSLTQAVPVALHVCGVLPEQRLVPGWQIPVHTPAEQTFGQTMLLFEFPQWPVASQSWGWSALVGEHRVAPGAQSAQVPLPMQTRGQAALLAQLPLASQC